MRSIFLREEHLVGLPLAQRKRLPILVSMNLLLTAYFYLSAFTRYRAQPEELLAFMLAVFASSSLYLVSLGLLRLGRFGLASYLSSLATLLNVVWIAFLLPVSGLGDIFRFSVYLIASCVANALVSLGRRQIEGYAALSVAILGLAGFFVFLPLGGGAEARSIVATQAFLLLAVNASLVMLSRLNRELLSIAEDSASLVEARSRRLGGMVDAARDVLTSGSALLAATDRGTAAGAGIRRSAAASRQDATGLVESLSKAREASEAVSGFVRQVADGVESQNAALEETSSSITQIMANVQSLAAIAQDKKKAMNGVLKGFEERSRELGKVVGSFSRIREGSKEALALAAGILDVSEKTNMLAMNASIEAAHAGQAGRGFAVISQEIRKLSEEVQGSTTSIDGALRQNDDAVAEAAATLDAYSRAMAGMNQALSTTFAAMDELLGGLSEMAQGAKEMVEATGSMQSQAMGTGEGVRLASERLASGARGLDGIGARATDLSERIAEMERACASIDEALAGIRDVGRRSLEGLKVLETGLAELKS